ncbi:TetR/AcrR family transcriptional regulator [Aeromicrobium sp. CFBP 8757]|uniref:TetR/AcrR family transcriptional regulator n=1 Tax=Aeromicrobium sp. CFBP 8757 TaxID=2775288 RepID=UPI00177E7D4E|nr:TetR/AcrR family transcriptional regulator [Aeromicrobium sp. CFBP 8757]MBD8607492.1 TetR/AcrR family transcriptional regulator [Aeromicrobium sp. CFBP 8757]
MSVIEMKPVRDRILDAAVEHYYAEGIRAVSADKLIAAAHVSKVTFYRHFPSKNDLIAAYLEVRAEDERASVTAKRAELDGDPAAVLEWYAQVVGTASCTPGFRGCPFINAAAEIADVDHPGHAIITRHRAWLTEQARQLLDELGVAHAAARAEQVMMLRDGAMVSGYIGNDAAQVAADLTRGARAIIGR